MTLTYAYPHTLAHELSSRVFVYPLPYPVFRRVPAVTGLRPRVACGMIAGMSADQPKKKAPKSKKIDRPAVGGVKRPSMKDVGRNPDGTSKQHVYDARIAQRVAFYVASGVTENEIAELLDIRPGKLRKLYERELKHGGTEENVKVAKAISEAAQNGDMVAAKFWMKARAGWKDGEGAQMQSPLAIHIHE